MTETTARGGVALGRGGRMLRQRKRDAERVLGEHRYEVGDPVVSRKAGEQGDTDVHHALGFRDYDGADVARHECSFPVHGCATLGAEVHLDLSPRVALAAEHLAGSVIRIWPAGK